MSAPLPPSPPLSSLPVSNPDGNPGGRFFGGLLMVIGVLVGLLSGLCSLGFLVVMMSDSGHAGPESMSALSGGLVVVMIVGGVPFLFGVGIFFVGRALYRASRPKPPSVATTFE